MNTQTCRSTQDLPPHELGTCVRECDTCLEYVNACRTLVEIRYDHEGRLDKELNQKGGTARANKFVHEMNLQEHFIFLRRFEAITAEVSYLYNQKIIKERVIDPDVVKRKKDPQEFQRAVADMKMAQRPAKERKQLSDFDKAVEVIRRATRMDEATAKSIVEEQFRKQGKVIA